MSVNHVWRKSSRCDSNLCVEVGADWERSSHCANGECLEVRAGWSTSSYCDSDTNPGSASCVQARRPNEVEVHVRDSADPTGPVLSFGAGDWRRFLAGLR